VMARYMVTVLVGVSVTDLVTVLVPVLTMALSHFRRRAAKIKHGAGAADLKLHPIPRISE
jgi:hypothetical protein